MNKLLKYGWSIVLGLSALGSCSSEEDAATQSSGPQPVKFMMHTSMPGETRTVTDKYMRTIFAKADSVGIFAYRRTADGTDGELYAANVKYTYDGSQWTVPADGAIISDPETPLNFYAYHPYRPDVTDYRQITYNVQTTQNVVDETGYSANYSASDALTVKSRNSKAGEHLVDLTFGHAFSLVRVRISGTEATDALTTVKLCGVKTQAVIDLTADAQPVAQGDATDMGMLQVSNQQSFLVYLVLLPSQEIAADVKLLEVTTKKEVKVYNSGKEPFSLNAFSSRTMEVVLGDPTIIEPDPNGGGMNVTQWLRDEDIALEPVE